MLRKRTLLLVVASLLCSAALFSLGVLLFGRFSDTEVRVIATTAILGGYALAALPSLVLVEQRRARLVAVWGMSLAGIGALAALVVLWWPGPVTGKLAVTAGAAALSFTQFTAMLSRRRRDDVAVVRPLYLASVVTGAALGALVVFITWATPDSVGVARALGSVAVLDALAVALQPVVARLRPPNDHYRLRLELDEHESPVVEVDAPDLAAATARAIRDAERTGSHVTGMRVER